MFTRTRQKRIRQKRIPQQDLDTMEEKRMMIPAGRDGDDVFLVDVDIDKYRTLVYRDRPPLIPRSEALLVSPYSAYIGKNETIRLQVVGLYSGSPSSFGSHTTAVLFPPSTMSAKPGVEESTGMDDLSRLQKRMEDLGVMFYTYLGIIQRDAPPISRSPDEAEETANDEAARKELAEKTPGFARDIVQCSRDIDALIDMIDDNMKHLEGKERELLDAANFESIQAGEEMTEAVDDAQKLLTSVRQIIAARETEP